jgi:hypothetical protein
MHLGTAAHQLPWIGTSVWFANKSLLKYPNVAQMEQGTRLLQSTYWLIDGLPLSMLSWLKKLKKPSDQMA